MSSCVAQQLSTGIEWIRLGGIDMGVPQSTWKSSATQKLRPPFCRDKTAGLLIYAPEEPIIVYNRQLR